MSRSEYIVAPTCAFVRNIAPDAVDICQVRYSTGVSQLCDERHYAVSPLLSCLDFFAFCLIDARAG